MVRAEPPDETADEDADDGDGDDEGEFVTRPEERDGRFDEGCGHERDDRLPEDGGGAEVSERIPARNSEEPK